VDQEYNEQMRRVQEAYERGDLSDEEYRKAVRDLDWLRPGHRK
jgi:uncharacterized membrane protein